MNRIRSIIALIIIVFIPLGILIWFRYHQSTGFATTELIVYPLLFGGLSILILFLLKKFYLKESVTDFNSGKGNWKTDILWGGVITIIYFIIFFIERYTLSNWLNFIPNNELLGLMLDMRENLVLIILWFGPVLWIGVALYEELIRIFMLNILWKFSNRKIWIVVVIFISSGIIGLAHWSQGSYGIVTITIKSLIPGIFFFKYRRLLPLVISHVLYDGIQVAILLITYPQ